MYIYALIFVQVCLLVTGQTLFKVGIDKVGTLNAHNFLSLIIKPQILGGLAIYVVATVLWFYIISLAKDKFSVIYPLGSLAYVLGVIVAMLVFKETIPYTRWIGVGLIVLGAFFIAR